MKKTLLAATAIIAISFSSNVSTALADEPGARILVSDPDAPRRGYELLDFFEIPLSDSPNELRRWDILSSPDVVLPNQTGGTRTTSLGYRSNAIGLGSIALGALSIANDPFVLSLGRDDDPLTELRDESIKRRIVHLAPGIDDTDGVNVAQLRGVEQKTDKNTEDILAAKLSLAANSGKIFDLEFNLSGMQAVFDYVQVNSTG